MSRPVLAAVALAACASAASAAAPRYTIELLADLPGGIVGSQGMAINAGGLVGGQSVAADGYYATQWATPGRSPESLGDLPGGYVSSMVYGINDAGTTVGTAYNGALRGFRKDANGAMVELKDLPGGSNASGAYAINNGGTVVGYSYSTASGFNPTAVYWTAASTTPIDIGDLPGGSLGSVAKAVNDAGVVVGVGHAASGQHAWTWTSAGGMVDINGNLQMSEANGLNEAGWVVGYSIAAGGSFYHSTLWHDGQIVDLGASNVHSFAQDINNRNQIVGMSNSHAMLWLGQQSFDLNSLVDGMPGGFWLERAMSINDAGQITGYGNLGSTRYGFVLTEVTAVPEPGTWTLMFAGLLATGSVVRRRAARTEAR
jgi:probable HAF family extracellular repeat protein